MIDINTGRQIAATFCAAGFLAFVAATVFNLCHRARCQRESLDEARRYAERQRIRDKRAADRGDWGTP